MKIFTEQEALIWNRFCTEICWERDPATFSEMQKNAVLCFWYDAEMNSGGHSGYFDCYPETSPRELVKAINTIAYKAISRNFLMALTIGRIDGWVKTDDKYYSFEPSLSDCLTEYVLQHKDEIFR